MCKWLSYSTMFVIAVLFQHTNILSQSMWEKYFSEVSAPLNSISFVNADTGLIVGGNNTILLTEDRGNTWSKITINSNEALRKVTFVNATVAWIIGNQNGKIWKTIDTGKTWTPIIFDKKIATCSFVNDSIGWLAGEVIYKTDNGGQTWDNIEPTINPDYNQYFSHIQFFDQHHGFAFIGNGLYKTDDGGISWNETNAPFYMNGFSSLFVLDSLNAWAVTDFGPTADESGVLKYSQTNNTWKITYSSGRYMLGDIYFVDSKTGWAIGCDNEGYLYDKYGVILKTTDGGESWMDYSDTFKDNNYLYAVYFIDENLGWIVGDGGAIFKYSPNPVSIDDSNPTNARLFELSQNYPNPFNARTVIHYQLSVFSEVEVSVYNISGQKVVTLVSEKQPAGLYQVAWDAGDVASGMYVCRLVTGEGKVASQKLVLLR